MCFFAAGAIDPDGTLWTWGFNATGQLGDGTTEDHLTPEEVGLGVLYQGQIPSPDRPPVAWRGDRVRFWAAIARGVMTEDAAAEARVSSPVGFRWFRHAANNKRQPLAVTARNE